MSYFHNVKYNAGQNIWDECRNKGRGQENLISVFKQFLSIVAKGLYLEGRLSNKPSPPSFEIFETVPNFVRS